ncbi:MAG: MarR family transcriptional regulator [Candidatus Aenigmarchaeota archaeon]|nr:MarR family transcriptional regulator [Candidatus Aenigmarchaeota archaeon]
MSSIQLVRILAKNKMMKKILKNVSKEAKQGKPGLSITQLSEKTGIERHRLSGILEVLTILGLLVVFQMGMVKVYAPAKMLLRMSSL